MFTKLLAIIRNTFIESLRQPIMVVLIIAGSLAVVFSIMSTANTLDNDNVLFIQIGLSVLLLVGIIMAAFTATNVLAIEIEQKTVLTVVSKPIPRPLFVLGKYIGVSAALTVAMCPVAMVFLLCYQHGVMATASHTYNGPVLTFGIIAFAAGLFGAIATNYLYRWNFVSTCVFAIAILETLAWVLTLFLSKDWQFQSPAVEFSANEGLMLNVILGMLLLYETLLLFCAIAIAVSTRLGRLMTIVITLVASVVIALNESVIGKAQRVDVTDAGFFEKLWYMFWALIHHTLPNLNFLWLADDLSVGASIPTSYVLTTSAYTGLFILAILSIAIALFQNREVG
jgi:ABC-2 type transport system permease protein